MIQPTPLAVLREPMIIEEEQNYPTRGGVDLIKPKEVDSTKEKKLVHGESFFYVNIREGKN